jgi:arylsulfatase A-like enzyme
MSQKTNILFITSDQQHWNTLGRDNPHIHTPNLDRLAAEGMVCERAYCPNPTCTPSRSSIITGKYPSQHGAWSLGTKLDEDEHTVGEDFSRAGYRTALVGKAHFQPLQSSEEFSSLESYPILQDLYFWRDFDQPFYGFDTVRLARNHADEAHVGQHYALWLEANGCDNWRDYFRPPTGNNADQKHRWPIPERYHYNAWIAEESNRLLDGYAAQGEPFFLWASFFDPHPPYLVPEPWDTMYDPAAMDVPQMTPGEHDANPEHFRMTQEEKPDFSAWRESGMGIHGCHSHLFDPQAMAKDIAIYYGMISLMDKYIGQILDRLDALGLTEQTLVVFTSDHGHFYGQHGLTAKGPFHYEDLVRLPFIVRQPGQVPAGQRTEALHSLVDLAPSFLQWCGLQTPHSMVGVDQGAVWRGNTTSARDHCIVENRHEPTTIHVKTYIDARYKLTVYYQREYGELFDLEKDPGEVHNLWHAQPQLRAELIQKMLFAEMGKEPLPMPRIAGA